MEFILPRNSCQPEGSGTTNNLYNNLTCTIFSFTVDTEVGEELLLTFLHYVFVAWFLYVTKNITVYIAIWIKEES
jgi:hypothetical protein